MKSVPRWREVEQKFKPLASAVDASLNALNSHAAAYMAQGKYDRAAQLAEKGQEIQAWKAELDALRKRWRALAKATRASATKGDSTALWEYYQPILRALDEIGGVGTRGEIEGVIHKQALLVRKSGDQQKMAGGRQRWQVMIQRARKHLVAEGWIEPDSGRKWMITASGRRAARAGSAKADGNAARA